MQQQVEGRASEVVLLQLHVVFATLWLLSAVVVAFLAVPRLRGWLSEPALRSLEGRRPLVVGSLWAFFGGTLITGAWLLSTMTAYEAPFSTNSFSFAAYDDVTRLPYASWYFNTLYLKIFVFLLMGLASVVLAMEAGWQAQRDVASQAPRVSRRTLWTSVAVVGGGTALIGLCVTILKYTHELIEAANAARVFGG